MPLWYAHYDNSPSFSDYSSFGGWSEPYAKQVNSHRTIVYSIICSGFTALTSYAYFYLLAVCRGHYTVLWV